MSSNHTRATVLSVGALLFTLLLVLAPASLRAGGPARLVEDLRPGVADSAPTLLTDHGGVLFFLAQDDPVSYTLWRTDVVAGTLPLATYDVSGARPGTVLPTGMLSVGDILYLAGDAKLWRSDGTAQGTCLVRAFCCTEEGVGPSDMTSWRGALYFIGSDEPLAARGLWKSNGTSSGTVELTSNDLGITELAAVGDTLFFSTAGYESEPALWKSNGPSDSFWLIKDGISGETLTQVGNRLFFVGFETGSYDRELWTSDGTEAGTRLVKDIFPGETPYAAKPAALTDVAGTLFFTADDGAHGRELWVSDGTETGTRLVKDINAGSAGAFDDNPSYARMVAAGRTLFFVADDGAHGRELWVSDGTETGTMLVKDINPGIGDSATRYGYRVGPWLTSVGGRVLFAADDAVHGTELWVSDGQAAGTMLVHDVNPGIAASGAAWLTHSGAALYFSADDGTHGREPWMLPLDTLEPTPTATATPVTPRYQLYISVTRR